MAEISVLDLQNLRHLIGGYTTTQAKMTDYASNAQDPEIKQLFKPGLRPALRIAPTERIAFTLVVLKHMHIPAMFPSIAKHPFKVPSVVDRLRSAERQHRREMVGVFCHTHAVNISKPSLQYQRFSLSSHHSARKHTLIATR